MTTKFIWQGSIVNEQGDIQASAQVEIRVASSGALATLYEDRDGTTPKANPFNADLNGYAFAYMLADRYNITASKSGFSRTWSDVLVMMEPQLVITSVNTVSGGDIVIDPDDLDDSATTNKFTTASDITKLAGIEAGAEVNTVDSVNGQTGVVVLDPDDLDDTATTNKFTTASDITKLAGIEAGADVTDAGNVGSAIHGASAKTTPVDADELGLLDSAASYALKRVTVANLKAGIVSATVGSISWIHNAAQTFTDAATAAALFATQIEATSGISISNSSGTFTPAEGVYLVELHIKRDLDAGFSLTSGSRYVQLDVVYTGTSSMSTLTPQRYFAYPDAQASPAYHIDIRWGTLLRFGGTQTIRFDITPQLGTNFIARPLITFTKMA